MKAFIVLDGLNSSKLLENLIGVGRGWLGSGSMIIVHINGGVDKIHEFQKMNFQNPL